MTFNISLRFILFVAYTLALMGGAFGISYAVFEWRDDDGAFDASAIEERFDALEGKVDAESGAQKCAAALAIVNETAREIPPEGLGRPSLLSERIPNPVYETIIDLMDRYCD